MQKTIWCARFITLRGEEVSRAADTLHKPLLLHKRQHVLSNCQNLYFKDCNRAVCEVLLRFYVCGVCIQACVFCMSDCAWACTCILTPVYAHVLMFVYFMRASTFKRVFVCVYSICLLLCWQTLHWSLLLKSAALILHVSRPDKWKYARARRRKKAAALHEARWRLHCPGRPLRVPLGSN